MAEYKLDSTQTHYLWDVRHEPILRISSGDTVCIETAEVSSDFINFDSTTEDLERLDFDLFYPLSGPIYVEGAEPGDTLAVEILDVKPKGWGWMSTLAGAEGLSAMPPGSFGGNMDLRHLRKGATVYLPIQVEGALFSCGDGHAVQGDGEVCVTALEAPVDAKLRFTLIKGKTGASPSFFTPSPLLPKTDTCGWQGTTGYGEDLMAAAKDAVSRMVDFIVEKSGLEPIDAYLLASIAADLKITEIVDSGIWIVTAMLPLSIFRNE